MTTINTINLGERNVNVSTFEKVFPKELVIQAQVLIEKWGRVFVKEDTWVQREYKIPSFLVRLDCVGKKVDCVGEKGKFNKLEIFEIEERPGGIGIAVKINPYFREKFNKVRKEWPSILVVVSKRRKMEDDSFWTETTWSDGYFVPKDRKVLIRAEPTEEKFWPFEPFSVSSLRKKGDKAYGVSLGLWSLVTSENQLPWDEGFALKSLQGSKCHGIEIFDPKKRKGSSTKSRILRRFLEDFGGKAYVQPLIIPMDFSEEKGIPEELLKFKWYIWRIYLAFVPSTYEWMPLGGFWHARDNLRIHGASDACLGPLVPEE